MSQTLPTNGFKWEDDVSRFSERFTKSYNENSNEGYFLEVDVEYPKKIFGSLKDLLFLAGRKKIEQVEKLVFSIEDKQVYFFSGLFQFYHLKQTTKKVYNNIIKLTQ